ncbi:MAG: isocitrate lyase/phosphoenolpyruvate mutase family protein, partial [Pseudomonadota bacterium]|nr:isocitrate lyase/phosphoenolpyruvate mutase family protein [Pseudomonadota bacterium]
MLLLPNAWDVASALLQAACGAKAIGTSSAALAWALGHADGEALAPESLVAAVGRIAECLTVPLSVDVEAGYSADPQCVAEFVVKLHRAGAAGINIEDGSSPSPLLADKIAAIRARLGPAELFINARTDVVLRSLVEPDAAVALVMERASDYAAAGADGLFVPGLIAAHDARLIAASTSLSLNLMALPGLAAIEALRAAGVCRISAGPALFLSAYRTLRDDALAFVGGDVAPMFANPLSFGTVNGLYRSARRSANPGATEIR